jgi:hypothetical protein
LASILALPASSALILSKSPPRAASNKLILSYQPAQPITSLISHSTLSSGAYQSHSSENQQQYDTTTPAGAAIVRNTVVIALESAQTSSWISTLANTKLVSQ